MTYKDDKEWNKHVRHPNERIPIQTSCHKADQSIHQHTHDPKQNHAKQDQRDEHDGPGAGHEAIETQGDQQECTESKHDAPVLVKDKGQPPLLFFGRQDGQDADEGGRGDRDALDGFKDKVRNEKGRGRPGDVLVESKDDKDLKEEQE
ncbi:hypothetical protein G6F68_013727 [Rhizopus microsporus]|nr:hypothetical protein G6F68_013727 [Rhizopus microsporus]